MLQREREKKIMRKDVKKKIIMFWFFTLVFMEQFRNQNNYLFTMKNKVLKAANNSSRIPDLPTGYVNNINLIANEL